MSFILEALKKSDKKRQEGTVPRLETVHQKALDPGSRRPKRSWFLALALVLILNAGVLLWLFGPWQQQEPEGPVVEQRPAAVPPKPGKRPDPSSAKSVPVEKAAPAPLPVATQPVTDIVPTKSAAAIVPEQPRVQAIILAPAHPLNTEVTSESRVYSLTELPAAVRRKLPELHMSLHAFNREASSASLVRINDQFLREGGKLDGKYSLEKITTEGAVFRYDGYRFLVPRKGHIE